MIFAVQIGFIQIVLIIVFILGCGLFFWSLGNLVFPTSKVEELEDADGRKYRRFRRKRHFPWSRGIGGFFLALISFFFLFIAFAIQGFLGLTGEIKVATVHATFVSQQDHKMNVEVIIYDQNGNQTADTSYQVLGDQWRLEGDILAFKPWINFFGIHSGYKVTRLSGRFSDENINLENYAYNDPIFHNTDGEFKKAMEINGGDGDFFKKVYKQGWSSFMVDAAYGNDVVEPVDGKTYNVYASQDALKARVAD